MNSLFIQVIKFSHPKFFISIKTRRKFDSDFQRRPQIGAIFFGFFTFDHLLESNIHTVAWNCRLRKLAKHW